MDCSDIRRRGMLRRGTALLAFSLLCGLAAAGAAKAMSEFGIDCMAVVSTPASEAKLAAIRRLG